MQGQASEHDNTQEPEVSVFDTTPDTEATAENAAPADSADAVEEPSPKPMPKSKSKKVRYAYYY
jgi:hypothetical protein